ncbi:MAG: ROK family protein [Terriglobales bacterium]
MSTFAIGVDLGGTNLRIAAVSDDGRLLESVTLDTGPHRGRDAVLDGMCRAIREVLGRHAKQGTLAGIGIGVPGIIDMETGLLRESPNLPGWYDYPVRDEIERRLKTRVILENDANAAALGEFWIGAARDVDDSCMITLGTGVGGGLVFDGHLWHGMTGMAGELGHITVNPDGPVCGCGSRGCIEQYASATAVKRMAEEALVHGGAPELERLSRARELNAKSVFLLAQGGDAAAQAIYATVGRMLGVLLAGLVNALNLPMYVIGGGVAGAWDAFAPVMIEEVRRRSFVYAATESDARRRTQIVKAALGGDAGLMGAARVALLAEEREKHLKARP